MKIKTPFFTLEIEDIFLIVVLVTILSPTFRCYIDNYFVCYLFILFHELSHMLLACIFGKEIDSFRFSVCGVNLRFKYSSFNVNSLKKSQEILIYVIGPFSNILLAMLFSNNLMIFQINLFLAAINFLPLYPLDGYNIIKIILKSKKNNKNKTYILNIVTNTIYTFLFVMSFFQIILIKNPSILIFLIYVILISKNNKNVDKF